MPVSFNTPARNFFLLASTGGLVGNFFKTIDQSATTDTNHFPAEIRYNESDEKYLLSGSAKDSTSKDFGFLEKRDLEGVEEWGVRVESTEAGVDTTLRAMELDSNNNLIVAGKTGNIPWVAKYDNNGVVQWQSTTNSADVEYTGLAIDSDDNIYACGATLLPPFGGAYEAIAFVEKFDADGNPGWGKSAFMLDRNVVLQKCSVNSRGEVVAVGYLEDDSTEKGYIVKIDTNTGEVLWDRTLISYDLNGIGEYVLCFCEDVHIDNLDQIYVVGQTIDTWTSGNPNRGFIIKYSPEGNIIWQRQTDKDSKLTFFNVRSDGDTEQTIVMGGETFGGALLNVVLSSYAKNGDLIWRRKIVHDNRTMDSQSRAFGLDFDSSFYYIFFRETSFAFEDTYTYARVSISGNGAGNFDYDSGATNNISYDILNIEDKIGRISDGSVRNDSSDLITYPFNGTNILFDDLATQVSNKKRQMDGPDSFEYSGSPAIKPANFSTLNIDGSKSIPSIDYDSFRSSEFLIEASDGFEGDDFGESVCVDKNAGKIFVMADVSQKIYVYDLDGTNEIQITPAQPTTLFGYRASLYLDKINQRVITIDFLNNIYSFNYDGSGEIKFTCPEPVSTIDNFNVFNGKIIVQAYRDIHIMNTDGTGLISNNFPSFGIDVGAYGKIVGNENSIFIPAASANVDGVLRVGKFYELDYNLNIIQIVNFDPTAYGANSYYGTGFQIVGNQLFAAGRSALAVYNIDNKTIYYYNFNEIFGRFSVSFTLLSGTNTPSFFTDSRYIFGRGSGANRITVVDLVNLTVEVLGSSTGSSNFSFPKDLDGGYLVASGSTEKAHVLRYEENKILDLSNNLEVTSNGATWNASGWWEFDGVNDYISIDKILTQGSELTIESWFNTNTLSSTQYIVDQSVGLTGCFIRVLSTTQNLSAFVRYNIGNAISVEGTISSNTWHHVILTISAGENRVRLYIDGILQDEDTTIFTNIATPPEGSPFAIGSDYQHAGEFFDGEIGEVRIYPRALTAAQVFQNYNATKSKYINEAPDTAPKIGPGIVYDSNLLLNYDFGNKNCYNNNSNLIPESSKFNFSSNSSARISSNKYTDLSGEKTRRGILSTTNIVTSGSIARGLYVNLDVESNTTYTFSFYVKMGTIDDINSDPNFGSISYITSLPTVVEYKVEQTNGTPVDIVPFTNYASQLKYSKYTRIIITFTTPADCTSISIKTLANQTTSSIVSRGLYIIDGIQFEKSSIATPYIKTYGSAITAPTTVKNLSSTSYPGNISGPVFDSAGYFQFGQSNTSGITNTSFNYDDTSNPDFTVEAWVWGDNWSSNGNSYNGIMNRSDGNHIFSTFINTSTGSLGSEGEMASWRFSSSGTNIQHVSSGSGDSALILSTGVWNHCVWVWKDGLGYKYYLNNSSPSIHTTNNTGRKDSTSQFTIGKWFGDGFELDGRIASLCFYSRELTATEISQNFNATRSKYGV